MNRIDRGQILALFALMLVALFALAALAIDVSGAYAARQFYRTAADAASLAGAQDLQGTNRVVSDSDRINARTDALLSLAKQLEPSGQPYVAPSGPSCDPSADITRCQIPNTGNPGYQVRITTPVAAGGCVSCDPNHSIAVTVTNPSFQLSFARVLGFDHWNVASTSVAGPEFPATYALITLRPFAPPRNNAGTDPNDDDISLSGGQSTAPTTVNVINGDVGTNSYVVTGSNTMVQLLDGYPSASPAGQPTPSYRIYHIDQLGSCSNPTTACDTWNKDVTNSYPVGWKINQLLNDPQYLATANPARPTTTLTQAAGSGLDKTISSSTDTCLGAPAGYLPVGTECFKPGVYAAVFAVTGSAPGVYLEPGVYFFDKGIKITSGQSLWGGLQSGEPGVAIVVPQQMTGSNAGFDTASADSVVLNSGAPTCTDRTCRAAPAKDINNKSIATPAPQGLPLTIIVPRDPSCFSGAVPQLCSDNQNTAVKLAGNSALTVGGVIYAPSDKMQIASNNTAQNGVVGQIIGWTVSYTGHASLNQEGPPSVGGGTIRLDAACTVPGTACIP